MTTKIRLIMGPDSELDTEFFTTDSAIQGLIGLLDFGNDQDKATAYLNENECPVRVSFLARGDQEIDGQPIPQQQYHNLFINIENLPGNEYHVVVASPLALKLYEHYNTMQPEDPLPEEFRLLDVEFNTQVAGVVELIPDVDLIVGTVGLMDDTGHIEPALVVTFRNGAELLDKAAEERLGMVEEYQKRMEEQAAELLGRYQDENPNGSATEGDSGTAPGVGEAANI